MQLAGLNSKPHGVKSLRDIIDRTIGFCFYPPPVSEHYKLLHLEKFHESTDINNKHKNNNETKPKALFNMLHQTPAGKLRTKIISLTTYIHVD